MNCIVVYALFFFNFNTGRYDFDKPTYYCPNCKKDVSSLSLSDIVQAGYWPGSPTDSCSYLFDQTLFLQWSALQKRMPGTSETAFIKALEDVSAAKGRVSTLDADKNHFNDSFTCMMFKIQISS